MQLLWLRISVQLYGSLSWRAGAHDAGERNDCLRARRIRSQVNVCVFSALPDLEPEPQLARSRPGTRLTGFEAHRSYKATASRSLRLIDVTTLVLATSFQDNFGKPVPGCQTILDFAAATDD